MSGVIWTVLSLIAIVSLIVFFSRGPNAVWGGATGGLVIGVIIAFMRPEGFALSIVWKGVVIGSAAGLVAEMIGVLVKRLSRP